MKYFLLFLICTAFFCCKKNSTSTINQINGSHQFSHWKTINGYYFDTVSHLIDTTYKLNDTTLTVLVISDSILSVLGAELKKRNEDSISVYYDEWQSIHHLISLTYYPNQDSLMLGEVKISAGAGGGSMSYFDKYLEIK
jgi:hypothetical protein